MKRSSTLCMLILLAAAFINAQDAGVVDEARQKQLEKREAEKQAKLEELRRQVEKERQELAEQTRRERARIEQRYVELETEFLAEFAPPETGDEVRVKLRRGGLAEGVLLSVGDPEIRIRTSEGVVRLRKGRLAKSSTIRFFASDYAKYWAHTMLRHESPQSKEYIRHLNNVRSPDVISSDDQEVIKNHFEALHWFDRYIIILDSSAFVFQDFLGKALFKEPAKETPGATVYKFPYPRRGTKPMPSEEGKATDHYFVVVENTTWVVEGKGFRRFNE